MPDASQFGRLNVWAILKNLVANDLGPFTTATAPVNGTSGTFVNKAGPGALLLDTVAKRTYVNVNTKASPTWVSIGGNFFLSTEQTGTGAGQNIAHGLGVVPSRVIVVPSDLNVATIGAYTATYGAHDATNVVVTVTTSKKFFALAWA